MSVADISRYLPAAVPQLKSCQETGEKQKVIEFHLAEALDAPGALTKEKVEGFSKVVHFFYSEEFLKSQLKEITSIFTQVIYLNAALEVIEREKEHEILKGGSKPMLIKGKLLPDHAPIKLGVFKIDLNSSTYHISSNRQGVIRERIAYLTDKKNVPPTFMIDTLRKGMGSFQLFFENSINLFEMIGGCSSLSFPRAYVRELAFSEIKRMNADAAISNVLISEDRKTLKFIDGACAFPRHLSRHRISTLFNSPFAQHLSGSFSEDELSEVQKIDIDAVCTLLKNHELDDMAIYNHRCVLLMLKEVIPFNQISPTPISLEDLLVITNISDPRGYYYFLAGYYYGGNTLFSYISEIESLPDAQISTRIQTVFNSIVHLKSRDNPRPVPREEPGFIGSLCSCFLSPERVRPGNADEDYVHDYYHNPFRVVFFGYGRN